MEKFTKAVENAWNLVRARKGLPPISEAVTERLHTGPSIIHRPKAALQPEPDPPPFRTQEEMTWSITMTQLTPLEPIFAYIADREPALWGKVGALEERCHTAARVADADGFTQLRKKYLDILGKCCEVYAAATATWEEVDILSARFNGQRIRLHKNDATPPTPGPPIFYAREIPWLLTATDTQIQDILLTKDVFSGAQTVST